MKLVNTLFFRYIYIIPWLIFWILIRNYCKNMILKINDIFFNKMLGNITFINKLNIYLYTNNYDN